MAEPLRRRIRSSLLEGLTFAAGSLPTPVVRTALSGLAGAARFSRYERLARENLELALGRETSATERAAIARGVRLHAARLAQEWALLASGGGSERRRARMLAWLDRTVEFDPSIARLDAALAQGRGVLVATAHIGNWELLAAGLRRRGHAGCVVGFQKRRDPVANWLVNMRRAYDVETLPQDSSPRRVLEILRSGQTLGILCDLEARRIASERVPFFGLPALTMTAPASLARAAQLPVLPARCIVRADAPEKYVVLVEEPLELDRALERRAAARDLLARLNAIFERWIRETPEQWAWHQPRWRRAPEELQPAAPPA
jgi:Kdo2-lipid IVA lauroyltransferase/acyltransferase